MIVEYVDLESDFDSDFHHLDPLEKETCLRPEAIPECYAPGQNLA